jgi:hypothetical protein
MMIEQMKEQMQQKTNKAPATSALAVPSVTPFKLKVAEEKFDGLGKG